MALDLGHGEKIYRWFGRREFAYRAIRWVSCLGRERFFAQQALEALGLEYGQQVLDLACGTGFNFEYLAPPVGPAGKVLALDYSAEMLSAARRRAVAHRWTQIEFLQADASRVVLPTASLDGILCTFGLSVMPGEIEAVKNLLPVLRPKARFVVFDAKPFTGFCRWINPIHQPFFKYVTNWDYRKDVIGMLRQSFPSVEVREYGSGCNYIAVCRKAD